MINPFRPSAKVIIKKVEINIRGGEVPGERGGEGGQNYLKAKRTLYL